MSENSVGWMNYYDKAVRILEKQTILKNRQSFKQEYSGEWVIDKKEKRDKQCISGQ